MVFIPRYRPWSIHESLVTPEEIFRERRSLLKSWGMGGLCALALGGLPSSAIATEDSDPVGELYPARSNSSYKIDRDITPEAINSKYNNFYEFGSHKQIYKAAQGLVTHPWDLEIDGMVENPVTIAFEDLIRKVPLEERLYRHRCVEAWSMTIPWTGFALSELLRLVKPLSSAKYVRFETFLDPNMASGQKQIWYPWPYVEGVTIDEAANDLAFLVTGAYGKPLAKQFGAPVRLALPWKYGFKSIKSIRKITLTDERPVSFWEEILPSEYGFWANVNPEVPHARWSQAEERVLGTTLKIPTQIFNGYGDQVAHLYQNMEAERLFT